ncbi:hypothetical protein KAX02_08685 [candidate division WOR-3 bacterium]|nr:hypothetical protein [candidate division WOR-3 bacterium]
MAGITTIGIPQDIKQRATITIVQDGTAQTGAKGYMPFAGDVVACGFFNNNGAGDFTAAAKIAVTGGTVASSSATLNQDVSERITSVANNTGLAKGAAITLTTGTDAGATGPTVAIVEIEGRLANIV